MWDSRGRSGRFSQQGPELEDILVGEMLTSPVYLLITGGSATNGEKEEGLPAIHQNAEVFTDLPIRPEHHKNLLSSL